MMAGIDKYANWSMYILLCNWVYLTVFQLPPICVILHFNSWHVCSCVCCSLHRSHTHTPRPSPCFSGTGLPAFSATSVSLPAVVGALWSSSQRCVVCHWYVIEICCFLLYWGGLIGLVNGHWITENTVVGNMCVMGVMLLLMMTCFVFDWCSCVLQLCLIVSLRPYWPPVTHISSYYWRDYACHSFDCDIIAMPDHDARPDNHGWYSVTVCLSKLPDL